MHVSKRTGQSQRPLPVHTSSAVPLDSSHSISSMQIAKRWCRGKCLEYRMRCNHPHPRDKCNGRLRPATDARPAPLLDKIAISSRIRTFRFRLMFFPHSQALCEVMMAVNAQTNISADSPPPPYFHPRRVRVAGGDPTAASWPSRPRAHCMQVRELSRPAQHSYLATLLSDEWLRGWRGERGCSILLPTGLVDAPTAEMNPHGPRRRPPRSNQRRQSHKNSPPNVQSKHTSGICTFCT